MSPTVGTVPARDHVQVLQRGLQLSGRSVQSPALCKVIVEGCMQFAAGETISSISKSNISPNLLNIDVTTEESGKFTLEFYTMEGS